MRPRLGPDWHEITPELQQRILSEREKMGWLLSCKHKAVVNGKFSGRPVIHKATSEGLQRMREDCCARTIGPTPAFLEQLKRDGHLPRHVLNVDSFAKAIVEHDWPDKGLLTRVCAGIATMYCGPRAGAVEGVDLYVNNKSTMIEGSVAQAKLKAAFAKDHKGVPAYNGQMLPHLIRLGSTVDEALETLWRIAPSLQGETPWMRICSLSVLELPYRKPRVLDDMSMGDKGVNHETPGVSLAKLYMTTHDDHVRILKELQKSGKRVFMKTVDASQYFRCMRTCQKDWPTVCVRDEDGVIYCREGCGFGGRAPPAASGSITLLMVQILISKGLRVTAFCDDYCFYLLEGESEEEANRIIADAFAEMGIPIQAEKDTEWSVRQTWLGFIYDTEACTRCLSQNRCDRYAHYLEELLALILSGKKITEDDVGSIYHSLLSARFVVHGAKPLLFELRKLHRKINRQLQQQKRHREAKASHRIRRNRGARGSYDGVLPWADLKLEVEYWLALVRGNWGVPLLTGYRDRDEEPRVLTFATDASGTGGGGVFGLEYFHMVWNEEELERIQHWGRKVVVTDDISQEDFTIAVLEFWALLCGASLWFERLRGRRVTIEVDNKCVEAWGNRGWPKSENSILGILGREWHRLCLVHDVDALLIYVTSELNEKPDALSRQEWDRFETLTQGLDMVRVFPCDLYQGSFLRLSNDWNAKGQLSTPQLASGLAAARGFHTLRADPAERSTG